MEPTMPDELPDDLRDERRDLGSTDPTAGRALAAADATGLPYDVVHIDPALADTAAFCAAYGYAPEVSANCLLVASRDDEPKVAACLVLATTRLDVNRRVRQLMGVRKLSFAPAELTVERTGMQIGGVTPFGLDPAIPLYVDQRIATLERIIVGGGSRSVKLLVPPAALIAIGGEYVTGLALDLAPSEGPAARSD
jgi:prolyl-tRNA editing enzyme YbaK/EbsC (Cys-tRNA(Pro) deacylase)